VLDVGVRVIAAVRRIAGDHVRHNAYFRDFSSGVPDTMDFWVSCLRAALLDPVAAESVEGVLIRTADGREIAAVNLLSLAVYGRYQHTFSAVPGPVAGRSTGRPHAGHAHRWESSW